MALAFYVEDRRPDTLATAFAAHDEYLSIFTHFISGQQRKHKHDSNTNNANDNDNANANDNDNGNAPCMILTPAHDYYTAPYCFMPKNDRAGFLVFTAQVPWLHGNPLANADNNNDDDDGNNNNNNNNGEQNNHGRRKQNNNNNNNNSNDDDNNNDNQRRRQQQRQCRLQCHRAAHEWQDARGKFEAPHVGSVESFQRALSLREREVYTFTETGCYPDRDDVSQSLEDRAVKVTCDAMGWEMPKNWRAARRKMSRTHSPILNLADWDSRKKRKNRDDDDDDDDDDGNDIADAGGGSNDSNNHHNGTITTNEKGENNANDRRPSRDVRREEKKDSAEEYRQC